MNQVEKSKEDRAVVTGKGTNLRVVISGGGTGGHLYPALAIAGMLRDRYPGIEICFVGALGRIEMEKVPEYNFNIVGLPIKGLNRGKVLSNIDLPFKLGASLWKARRIITRINPHVVVGTGGYASGPVSYMAARKKIPVLLQEQNFYPGLTNRMMSAYASKICVAYEGMEKWLPANKLVITGNPVREELGEPYVDNNVPYQKFDLSPGAKTLLVLGGSGGAKSINDTILNHSEDFELAGINVLWQTGKAYYSKVREVLEQENNRYIRACEFIDDMRAAYQVADLVVCRAGAITLAELGIAGKPAILIPSPNVVADHQTKNAEAMLKQDAALMVKDEDAELNLFTEIKKLLTDNDRMSVMAGNMKNSGKPGATEKIVQEILKLSGINEYR